MNVELKGYGENAATFLVSGSLQAGQFVKFSADNTVTAAVNGTEVMGYCLGVRDGYAAVQLSGYIEAKSTGTIDRGMTGLNLSAADTVQANSSACKHLVVKTGNNKVGFIL